METYFFNLSISMKIAIISFTIGTLLFGAFFLIPSSENLIFIGLFYTLLAITLNGIVFLKLIYNWITDIENRNSTAKQGLVILANIPITILYLFIIFYSITSNSPF